MWACANCRENVEDQFDACWKCGTSRDGKLNLDFVSQSSGEGERGKLEATIAENYTCPKCKHCEPRFEKLSLPGTGFRKLSANEFLAVTCEGCGYTELFSLNVLEGRTDLHNFIRGFFGS